MMTGLTRRRLALLPIAASITSLSAQLPAAALISGPETAAGPSSPVLVGLDLEFGHTSGAVPEAVRRGVEVAAAEINAAGGLLGGRPLASLSRDNRGIPTRAVRHVTEFAAVTDLVAVFCGRLAPTALAVVPLVHELGIPLLDPWAAVEGVTEHGRVPSYTFRLSMQDALGMRRIVGRAAERGWRRIALVVPDGAWGRSSHKSAREYIARSNLPLRVVQTLRYSFGDQDFTGRYAQLRAGDVNGIVFVGLEAEAALLVQAIAAVKERERLPVLSHWGIFGGDFVERTHGVLQSVDFEAVTTFTFERRESHPRTRAVLDTARRVLGLEEPTKMGAAAGFAHAYDLTWILAHAVTLAGTTDRTAVRSALEQVVNYDGLVRHFARPFEPGRHDALSFDDVIVTRFSEDGRVVEVQR